MKDRLKLGGVAGRHDIPNINGYVLDKVDDPADIEKINSDVKESLDKLNLSAGLNLYVTGLTSVTIAVIKYCFDNDVALTCYHFDMVSKTYLPQIVK